MNNDVLPQWGDWDEAMMKGGVSLTKVKIENAFKQKLIENLKILKIIFV